MTKGKETAHALLFGLELEGGLLGNHQQEALPWDLQAVGMGG